MVGGRKLSCKENHNIGSEGKGRNKKPVADNPAEDLVLPLAAPVSPSVRTVGVAGLTERPKAVDRH